MKQEQHFSYPLDLAAFVRGRLTELHARAPALAALEEILEVAFFASMKTEESEPVLCTLAYVDMKNPDPMPPERIVADRWSYVRFEQPIPLDVKNLVKVSKSIDSAFAALAVCRDSNERLVFRVQAEVGDEVFHARGHWAYCISGYWRQALARTLLGIQRYGHGGAVLLTPDNRNTGLSIKYPVAYDRLSQALKRFSVHAIKLCDTEDKIHESFLETSEALMPVILHLDQDLDQAVFSNVRWS